jgi:hypothetical protein
MSGKKMKNFELDGYKYALSKLQDKYNSGPYYLCNILEDYFREKVGYLNHINLRDTFPLFFEYKPDNRDIVDSDPWWPGNDRESRIEYLKMLIDKGEENAGS